MTLLPDLRYEGNREKGDVFMDNIYVYGNNDRKKNFFISNKKIESSEFLFDLEKNIFFGSLLGMGFSEKDSRSIFKNIFLGKKNNFDYDFETGEMTIEFFSTV